MPKRAYVAFNLFILGVTVPAAIVAHDAYLAGDIGNLAFIAMVFLGLFAVAYSVRKQYRGE